MPAYIRTRSEFAVNSYTRETQTAPSVSTFADGGFVVTWGSWDPAQDGYQDSIKAQLFDSAGRKVGPEFLVNTTASGFQFTPEVKALASGTFLVSWANLADDGTYSIRAQMYDRSGGAIGGEFQVDHGGAPFRFTPNIAALSNGGFVISWDDSEGYDVKAQIFDPAGSRVGGVFTMNSSTYGIQEGGDMTALAGGGFVATWRTSDTSASGTYDIRAQVFSATGAKLGSEFSVNNRSANNQFTPTITALSDGGFVVAWYTDNPDDGSRSAIKGQIFSASGGRVGSEFLVNSQFNEDQLEPVVTAVPGGGFMVAWTTQDSTADGQGSAIKAQMFDYRGQKVGGEMLVNTLVSGSQSMPDIATLADGRVVATWVSEYGDSSGYSIRAQILGTETAAPLPDTPPIIISNGGGAIVSLTHDEMATAVTTVVASDDGEPDYLRYSISGGEDAALFDINPFTGDLRFRQAPDHETPLDRDGDNFYQVTVAARDGVHTGHQTLNIYVRHLNQIHIISDGGNNWAEIIIGENNTFVTDVDAQDGDGAPITYAITGGEDAALFTIDAETGRLSFVVAPDYEWPEDMYHDNSYFVTVTATDGTVSDSQDIGIFVDDVVETGGFAIVSDGGDNMAEIRAPENETRVTVVTTQNAVGEVTYEIVGGADASWFTIDSATGELFFLEAPDFEEGERYSGWHGGPGHGNSYQVTVRASDGQSSDEQEMTILVQNVDEAPVFYRQGGAYEPGETGFIEMIEGGLRVGDIQAYDPDRNGPGSAGITYAIGGGADSALFEIDAQSGALRFIGSARPDFEAPADADGDNVYDVSVTAHSGSLSTTQQFLVYVRDQAELIAITSNGGGDEAVIDLAENTKAVATVAATGPGPLTFEIVGGTEQWSFTIDRNTGALSFNHAPDFESPTDLNYDNVYEVDVMATDGASYDFQHITVRVQPVDEAPYFYDYYNGVPVPLQVAENGSYISDLVAWDSDAGSQRVVYAIAGGADASRFWVDPVTGRFRFADSFKPDFDAPADAGKNNVYDVNVSATSGALSTVRAFAVTVTNVNEAPIITSNGGGASASLAIDERQTAVTTVVAFDPEASPVTYSIGGGTHASLFTINSTTGALRFVTAPDFEAPAPGSNNLYNVIVRASAGGHITSQTLQIKVNDVNESPTITSGGGGAVASVTAVENQTEVATVTATHPDPTVKLVYSIAGGADGSRFAINASTGVLTFVSAPDFEAPADAGGDNVYDVAVAVSDGLKTDLQSIAVTVSNVNELPTISGSQTHYSHVENGTEVATLAGNDPDGTALTWSIAGGADAARFAIDPATGALRFVTAPDFEAPADSEADNIYEVVVSASDGSNAATRTLTIQVSNSNEAPVFTSHAGGTSLRVNEDQAAVTTLTATDPDGNAVTFAISGGADAALFLIDQATGALRFIDAPDFEAPADSGGDNVYDIEVSAGDGELSATKSFSITVADTVVPIALGDEFVVNSTYSRTQAHSDVTRLADGNFIVTWVDADFNTTAGRFLRAQIFAPDGVKIGGELTLQSGNSVGTEPAVAALPDGGFVVASRPLGSIAVQMFDSAGAATSAKITVSNAGSGVGEPQIAVLANGGFAVTWDDNRSTGADISGSGVHLRVYDSAGATVGGDVLVNTRTAGNQADPSIAALAGGGYVVTWTDRPGQGAAWVGRAQIFDSAGARVGGEFLLNESTTNYGSVVETTVVSLSNGNFAVAWSESDESGPAHRIQIFTAAGAKVGEQIVAPSYAYGTSVGPALAALSDGGLAIAWSPNSPPQYDGSGKAVFVQAYDSAGQASGAPMRVSGQANGDQYDPSVAGLSDGRFVVTWTDLNGAGADDDQVMARIFVPEGHVPNQRPVLASSALVQVNEGQTAVTVIAASDSDGPDPVAYSISGGAHAALFDVDSATGALSFKAAPDFEAPAAGSGNVYSVIVRAGDGELSSFQTVQVAVRNVNEAVAITSGPAASMSENSTAVGAVSATDVDGTSPTFAISGGADASLFAIDAATGALSFVAAPNFEAPADSDGDNVYEVAVAASDGELSDLQTIRVTVGDVDEAVELISYAGHAAVTLFRAENGTQVGRIEARDPDGSTVTYSIAGGADANLFEVDSSTGTLSFVSAPDFESAGDAGGNNVYDVVVAGVGGGSVTTQSFAIAVTDRNEGISITSNGGDASASLSVNEGELHATTVVADDPDGSAPTYSIVGGPDAASFTIDSTTGVLTFIQAPDYEPAINGSAKTSYTLIVEASDGEFSDRQTIEIAIDNVNEGVAFTYEGGGDSAAATVKENSLKVAPVRARDIDGDDLIYSIAGGADASLFAIHPELGTLRFVQARNFEAPADADGDNVYEVVLSVTDGTFTDSLALAVTVADEDEALSITSNGGGSGASVAVTENGTAVTVVAASDPEAGTLSYAISGGADSARFTIDAVTGVLSFVAAPDFESPADSGADNVYDVIVSASDGSFTDSQSLSIAVGDVDEPVEFLSYGGAAIVAVNMVENRFATGIVVAARDEEDSTVTYAITGGADGDSFEIDPATGALSFRQPNAPDFEDPTDFDSDNVHEVVVTASSSTSSATQTFMISIANGNDAPGFAWDPDWPISMNEGDAVVTTIVGKDRDGTAPTYAIVGGPDAALFAIDAVTGLLTFADAPDYEAPLSAAGTNLYAVEIEVSDGELARRETFKIAVKNVNEGVTITSGGSGDSAAFTVSENGVSVTSVAATDVEGDALTYSIAGGADSARFTIDAQTGALSFVQAPNFEAPGDSGGDNVYDVVVSVTDGSLTDSQALTVTVANVDEPVEIRSYGGAAAVALTMVENGFAVATVEARDEEGWPVTYAITGGADADAFEIDHYTGALSFNYPNAPDFEDPVDSDSDNVYHVVVTAITSTSSAEQAFTITVTNRNEGIRIYSDDTASIDENGRAVATVVAIDREGTAPIYSIVGGADAALFAIDSATGALSFVDAPDYEAPRDSLGDNEYAVEVAASDGEFTDRQMIRITVGNVNEGVTITSGPAFTVSENRLAVTTIEAIDVDDNVLTYSIAGGADASRFVIDAQTGALSFVEAPNFEAPADSGGDNVYDVVVSATDGVFSDSRAVAVTVANLGEVVAISSNGGGANAAVTVAENGTAVATVVAADPDGGGAIAYAIAGGADAARFAIDSSTGALRFVQAPNFEAPADAGGNNVYDVVVSASNGVTSDTQALAVTIGNVNEQMAIASNGGGASASISVTENSTLVTTVVGVDPDGAPVTYAILHGGDSGLFTVNATTGVLAFRTAPNFEAPSDSNGDNIYTLTVMASDGHWSDTQAITVTVGNAAEAPAITSNGGGASASISVVENVRAVTTVAASDPEGAVLTYSIVGGADAARFTINAQTGVLQFVAAPDFELPGDSNQDNVYAVVVRSSDGQLVDDQALNVTVTNTRDGNNVTGTAGSDSISATSTNIALRTSNEEDLVFGRDGHDTIYGLAGDDELYGEVGNDVLIGGEGADKLLGGLGKDQFTYNALSDSTAALRDLIMDFSRAQGDKISLSAIDANSLVTSNQAFTFIGTAAFSNVAGQLRYETAAGVTTISGDVNGDGVADLQIQLSGSIALISSDFIL